jgi:conjugal transfer pilus assembly protein TraW
MVASPAKPIRAAAFVILMAAATSGVAATEGPESMGAMLEQAQRLQEQAKSVPVPEWLTQGGVELTPHERARIETMSEQARALEERNLDEQLKTNERVTGSAATTHRRIEFLVSWSLGETALREIMQEAAANPAAVVVFRGLPNGSSMGVGIARIQALLRSIDPPPKVTLDPTRFRRLHTDLVPTLSVYDGERLRVTARGTTSIRYVLARLKSGATGDLGAVGPVAQATEPDLIEVMQQRLAALDLHRYAEGARDRYWQRLAHYDLPQAVEPRTRHLDPNVVVVADIKDVNGTVIVPAGKRINPLDLMPFSQRLIVFDAARPGQVKLVEQLERRYRDKRVTLIAARLDREAGWDGFRKLQDGLHGPVFVLTSDIKERFQIERLPSVVEASGKEFLVHEIPPPVTARAETR